MFWWIVYTLCCLIILSKAAASSQVSKKQADAVSEAMKDYKQAQIEHDCKNSVSTRKNLKEKQENLRVLIRAQQGGNNARD